MRIKKDHFYVKLNITCTRITYYMYTYYILHVHVLHIYLKIAFQKEADLTFLIPNKITSVYRNNTNTYNKIICSRIVLQCNNLSLCPDPSTFLNQSSSKWLLK